MRLGAALFTPERTGGSINLCGVPYPDRLTSSGSGATMATASSRLKVIRRFLTKAASPFSRSLQHNDVSICARELPDISTLLRGRSYQPACCGGTGDLLGLERSIAGKHAGMRTYALVSLGSCLFVIVGTLASYQLSIFSGINPLQIAGSIVIGIGFIGSGLAFMGGQKQGDYNRRGYLGCRGCRDGIGLWFVHSRLCDNDYFNHDIFSLLAHRKLGFAPASGQKPIDGLKWLGEPIL